MQVIVDPTIDNFFTPLADRLKKLAESEPAFQPGATLRISKDDVHRRDCARVIDEPFSRACLLTLVDASGREILPRDPRQFVFHSTHGTSSFDAAHPIQTWWINELQEPVNEAPTFGSPAS